MWPTLLLLAAPEELTLPPKVSGGVTAALSVRVADQTPEPGTARVTLRLTVEGPAGLSVVEPTLEDAVDGWRVAERRSLLRPDGRRWECTLELVQVKPGVVPLPGVSVGVRAGGVRHDFTWPDLLHEAAGVAPVVEIAPPPPSPWPGRLFWAGLCALGLLGFAGVAFGVRRWLARPRPPLPPLKEALLALGGVRRGSGDPARLVAVLDGILRTYLETRGVPATRLTGAELGDRLGGGPAAEGLARILARVEEKKFAGIGVTLAQVRELADESEAALRTILGEEARPG